VVCTVHNVKGLGQRSGTVSYVPCIAVRGWVRGQVLFHLTFFIFVVCREGRAVLVIYSRQLVGSCTINDLYPINFELDIYVFD
jgi:hypothetical protein